MMKSLSAILAAVALAAATVSVPTKADAAPAWVIPVVVAAGVGGLALGTVAVASTRDSYAYAPGGSIYVQPTAAMRCEIVRERTASGWRRVEICR